MDRVLNQLQLAETMCVLKRRLVLAPYLFPSLRFSRELRRHVSTRYRVYDFTTVLSRDRFGGYALKFLAL